MSLESTKTKTAPQPTENPYPAPDREGSSDAPNSHNGESQYPAMIQESQASDSIAGNASAGRSVELREDFPKWLLLNLLVPILLLGSAGALVWALGTVQADARPAIADSRTGRLFALPAVDVVPIRSLESTGEKLHLGATGTVVPYREVSLATEVAGQIVEKSPLCESGKYVTKGHVLMKIDPTDYQLEVKRLQRLRQQEYESIGEVDQEMVNTKRSMELARADIELLQREVKRRESLPDQFASQGELDQARQAVLTAEQQLVLYQNQLELAKKRRTRLESSEQLAAMQLEAAENNLKRTEITAPIDGVIVSEQAELNTFVSRGSPVVTIEDTSKVEVATQLRTDQLYWVLNQRKATARSEDPSDASTRRSDNSLSDAKGDTHSDINSEQRGYRLPPTSVVVRYAVSGRDGLAYQWSGKLVGYNGIGLDEQTRTVPVRIVVDDPRAFEVIRDGKVVRSPAGNEKAVGPTTLVRGMFVMLRLELEPAVQLVVLPSEALKPGNRVWQFTPDLDVLDEHPPPKEKPEESDPDDDGDSSPDEAADPMASFDPEAWVAGKLRILHGVRPVDQFVTTDEFITPGAVSEDVDKLDEGAGQLWICEIPDNSLQDGSYVVISPLGSLRTDILPVRAPIGEVQAEPGVEVVQQ